MTTDSISFGRDSAASLDCGGVRAHPSHRPLRRRHAALAGMLKQRGYEVTGSDENVYPPMSTLLERLGIPILQRFRCRKPCGPAGPRGRRQQGVAHQSGGRSACSPAGDPVRVVAAGAGRAVHCRAPARWSWRARTGRRRPPRCWPGCWKPLAAIRASWSAATRSTSAATTSSAAASRLRHRRRRVRHRLLRQGAEVPPLPAAGAAADRVEFDHADIYRDLSAREGRVSPAGGAAAADGAARRGGRLPARARRGEDTRRPSSPSASMRRVAGRQLARQRHVHQLRRRAAHGTKGGDRASSAARRHQRAQRARRLRDGARARAAPRGDPAGACRAFAAWPPPGAGRRVRRRRAHRRFCASPDRGCRRHCRAALSATRAAACGRSSSRAPTPAAARSSSASTSTRSRRRIR